MSASIVTWNGTPLVTTYVSATLLHAAVPASLAVSAGSEAIAVTNPGGQSSGTGAASAMVTVDNGQPTISSLAPGTVVAGTAGTNIVVTGTNFDAGSVAAFGAKARATTVQSATQVTIVLTASDLATAGSVPITVTNPSPGGGTSASSALTIQAAAPLGPPVLTALSPASILVGSPETVVTVTGQNFTAGTQLVVNGTYLQGAPASPTTFVTTIPAQTLSYASPVFFNVFNSNTGASNGLQLPVLNPVPAIRSLSPATVTADAPAFQLTIAGTNTVGGTQVLVNGTPQQISPSPAGSLTVEVPADLVTSPGTVSIALSNPAPGGGISASSTLKVISGENRVRSVPVPASAIAWDPRNQLIYAAVSTSTGQYANHVIAINPLTAAIVGSQAVKSTATVLSITDDQQYLYVGLPGAGLIQRLKLPSLTPDIQWSVPANPPGKTYSIGDVEAAPGAPHTVAVTVYAFMPTPNSTITIYDDGVARPVVPVGDQDAAPLIQWGADDSVLYGTHFDDSGGSRQVYSVNASGATLTNYANGVFAEFAKILYDPASAHLYDSDGDVIDPASSRLLGRYGAQSSWFAVDSTLRRVFFLEGSSSAGSPAPQIEVFDQNRFTALPSLEVPSASSVGQLIRWGAAGLAFGGNSVTIIDGPFVAPDVAASSATGGYVVPAPHLSAVSQTSVQAGSPDTTVTLSGSGFSGSTTVTWNGNAVSSTLVNSTAMQVTLPAALLASATAGPLLAMNDPNTAISNGLAFTVLPSFGPDLGMAVVNAAGNDLVWDRVSSLLYEAVGSSDAVYGNSVVTIDPVAAAVKTATPAASEPSTIAVSGDGAYLYAGFGAAPLLQRYSLPAMTPDLQIPLSAPGVIAYVPGTAQACNFALSVEVAPDTPGTVAVSQGSCGAVEVFDGAVARSKTSLSDAVAYGYLTWGANDSTLFAQSLMGFTDQYLLRLNVSASGLTTDTAYNNDLTLGYRPHFDATTGYIYSDGGAVTSPDGELVGTYAASGLMVPDAQLGRAFFLGQTEDQIGVGTISRAYTLQIYDLTHFTLLDSIVIPNVIGLPEQMVRWGANGIAFTTAGIQNIPNSPGLTYILTGAALSTGTTAQDRSATQIPHVQLSWKPKYARENPRN